MYLVRKMILNFQILNQINFALYFQVIQTVRDEDASDVQAFVYLTIILW